MDDIESGHMRGEMKQECREALHRIYHFLDGELTPDVKAQIQRHIDDCPPCIDAFHFEVELRMVVARGCQEPVPESLRLRIAALIDHERQLP